MFHENPGMQPRIFSTPDTDTSFGVDRPAHAAHVGLIADMVSSCLNSCAEEADLVRYPSPDDVRNFIEQFISEQKWNVENVQWIAQKADQVIKTVLQKSAELGCGTLTEKDALRVSIAAVERGIVNSGNEPSPSFIPEFKKLLEEISSATGQLGSRPEGGAAQEANTSPSGLEVDTKTLKMGSARARLHKINLSASAEDITKLVSTVGADAYSDLLRFWSMELPDKGEYDRVGKLSEANDLARRLRHEAQGEALFDEVFRSPHEYASEPLDQSHALAIARKIRLRAFSASMSDQGLPVGYSFLTYLSVVASNPDEDMFLRREAVRQLGVLGSAERESHTFSQIISDQTAPLCVRFAAEVALRNVEGRSESPF